MFGIAYLIGTWQQRRRYKLLTQIQPSAGTMPCDKDTDTTDVDPAVIETVKAVKATLEMTDTDKANDPEEITNYIKDETNHIAIRDEIDSPMVEEVPRKVSDEELPPYVAPEGTFSAEELFRGEPLPNLHDLEHQEFVAIHHSPGGVGSKGSYIVGCRSGAGSEKKIHLVVLKELTQSSPAEVFAAVMMRHVGLNAPKMRILSSQDFENLSIKLRNARQTVEGSCNVLFDASTLKSGMLVMEFMRGKTLLDATETDLKHFHNASMLEEIGRCMAVDMALNCLDRIPIIWNNNGNATNLMLNGDHIAVIDSAYNRVLVESAAMEKAANVRACIEELKAGQKGECSMRVWDFFHAATNGRLVITDEEMALMMRTVRETCQRLAKNHEEMFTKASQETRNMFKVYLENGGGIVGVEQLDEGLDLDFCTLCAKQMDSGL